MSKKRRTSRQKRIHATKPSKNKWKGHMTSLMWGPSWKTRKTWHERLQDIQNEINDKQIVIEKKPTKRRPATG